MEKLPHDTVKGLPEPVVLTHVVLMLVVNNGLLAKTPEELAVYGKATAGKLGRSPPAGPGAAFLRRTLRPWPAWTLNPRAVQGQHAGASLLLSGRASTRCSIPWPRSTRR